MKSCISLGDIEDVVENIEVHYSCTVSLVYPLLADDVEISSGDGPWVLGGSYTEIVPENTITEEFSIEQVGITYLQSDGIYLINLYAGDSYDLVAQVRPFKNSLDSNIIRVSEEKVAANSKITAKMACDYDEERTAKIHLYYHKHH